MRRRDLLALALAGIPGLTYGQSYSKRISLLAHFCTWHRKRPGLNQWDEASTIPWRSDGNGIGYDSLDPLVLREQCREMTANGIIPLASWWGPKSLAGDSWLDLWVSEPRPVPVAVLYEGQDDSRTYRNPDGWWHMDSLENAFVLRSELAHLYEKYFSRYPNHFYHVDGRTFVLLWPFHAWTGDVATVLLSLGVRDKLFLAGTGIDELRLPDDNRTAMVGALDAVTAYNMYSAKIADENLGLLTPELIARYRSTILVWQDWLAKNLPKTKLILPMTLAYDDHNVPGRHNPSYGTTPDSARGLMAEMLQIISHFYVHCGNVLPLATVASYNEHKEGSALEPNDGRWGSELLKLTNENLTAKNLPVSLCSNE